MLGNIEDIKEQLEALKTVNEGAYQETVKAIKEQKKLEAQLKLGAIASEEYKKKTDELNKSLSAEAKQMKELQEGVHDLIESKEKLKKVTDEAAKRIGQFTGAADALTGLNLTMFTSFKDTAKGVLGYSRTIQGLNVELRRSTGFADRHVKSFDSIRSSYASVGLDAAQSPLRLVAHWEQLLKILTSLGQNLPGSVKTDLESLKN